MIAFLVRRMVLFVLSLFVASIIIFVLLRLVPGDLAHVLGGINATPERLVILRHQLGLDRSLFAQYGSWVGRAVHGDFGKSALNGQSAAGELWKKLHLTGPLVLASTVVSIVVAVPLGIVAAARHRTADGVVLSAASQLGIALPTFWVGLMLVVVFAVHWRLFPSGGFPINGWSNLPKAVKSLVLPTITLALSQGAVLFRFVRSATLEVLNQDYIRTARAKGLTKTQALWRHGLRNAAIPIVSILGVQIASLIAGVVVIEQTFALGGVGSMLVKDIGDRDFEKVQGTVLLLAVFVLLIGFLVDIVHRLIDPRLRAAA